MQSIGQLMYVGGFTLNWPTVFGITGVAFFLILSMMVVVVAIYAMHLKLKTKKRRAEKNDSER